MTDSNETPLDLHASSEAYEKAVRAFGEAVDRLHKGEFQEALTAFEGLVERLSEEPSLAERARTYAKVCRARLAPADEAPQTAEDCYQRAVLQINRGETDEAIHLLNRAMQEGTSAKYLYARASAYALKGNAEAAVADLRQAIADEPQIRFQAVNDPDFEGIREEPAFIDIIEPTPAGA